MALRAILVRFILTVVFGLAGAGHAMANRVALIIGNSDYRTVASLPNPVNDSDAVTEALRAQGFEVLQSNDLTREGLYDALRGFRDKADTSEIALVYYAGHGIEIGGVNYLVPVDADLKDDRDASVEMVTIQTVLAQISGASRLKMVVLDACRDNPFVTKMKREGAGRNVGRGLAIVDEAGSDTLIAYAAAAGEVTPDGRAGGNSPFTSAFLTALSSPPADVRQLLGIVRDELRVRVPGSAPFVYSSLGGGQYVINPNSKPKDPPKAASKPKPKATQKPVASASAQSITRDFAAADRAGTIETWDAFLQAYSGDTGHPLYTLALEKLVRLQRVAVASAMAPVQPPALPQASAQSAGETSSMRVANFDDSTTAKDLEVKPKLASPAVAQGVLAPGGGEKPPMQGTEVASLTLLNVPLSEQTGPGSAQQRAAPAAPPLASDGTPVEPEVGTIALRPGFATSDEAARAIQNALKARGCYGGAIDGILGRGSASGLRRFSQQAKEQVLVTSTSTLEELVAAHAQLEAHPEVRCPKVQTVRRKSTSTKRKSAAAQQPGITVVVPARPRNKTFIIEVD